MNRADMALFFDRLKERDDQHQHCIRAGEGVSGSVKVLIRMVLFSQTTEWDKQIFNSPFLQCGRTRAAKGPGCDVCNAEVLQDIEVFQKTVFDFLALRCGPAHAVWAPDASTTYRYGFFAIG